MQGARTVVATFVVAIGMAVVGTATASAQATAPRGTWNCSANPVVAKLLGTDLITGLTADLLAANNDAATCEPDEAGIEDLLEPLPLGISAGVLHGETEFRNQAGPTAGRSPEAYAEVADVEIGVGALPGLPTTALLRVQAAEASAKATCVAGVPTFTGASRVDGIQIGPNGLLATLLPNLVPDGVDTVLSAVQSLILGLPLGTVVRLTPNEVVQDGSSLTRRALRVQILNAIGGSLLDATVAEAKVSLSGTPCVAAPTVAVIDSGENRVVAATATANGGRTITNCELEVRPAGSTGAFTDVTTTYDPTTGRCEASLPRATFPAGDYDVRATAIDENGDSSMATGAATVAVPVVGTPTTATPGREITAPVTAAAGTTITSCAVVLVPSGGGSPTTVTGAFQAATSTCTATAPVEVQSGSYSVTVTAVDDNGDSGSATATVMVGASPAAPTVQIVDSGINREVLAEVTPPPGGSVTACAIGVRPAGSAGAFTDVPATYDPATGRCSATLPSGTFPVGPYEVQVTATDADGDVGTATGPFAIVAPTTGPITATGGTLSVPVQPAPGVDIDTCEYVLTPSGGGSATTVAGTYSSATGLCTADVPASLPQGGYDIVVTVTDDAGDTGSSTATATIGTPPTPPEPSPATVAFVDSGLNRVVTAKITPFAGETITGCTLSARPAGSSSSFTELVAVYDAVTGICRAELPTGTFPPGDYEVRATATDSSGDVATEQGTKTVSAPTVGTPTLGGTTVSVPVTPAVGTTITDCTITLTPAGGGQSFAIAGTFNGATGLCTADLPGGTPAGSYSTTASVTDNGGDTGTGTGEVTVPGGQSGGGGGGGTPSTPAPAATTPTPDTGGIVQGASFTDGNAGQQATQCTSTKIVLTDVRLSGSRTRLAGAAAPGLIGRTVSIRFTPTGEVVARAVVGPDGLFRTTAPPPARKHLTSKKARYVASAGGQKSRALKVVRRARALGVTRSGARLTFSGVVAKPLRRGTTVRVQQLVACGKWRTVASVALPSTGRFKASFARPAGQIAAIYRASTFVPSRTGGRATNRTFTTPTPITLG